MSFSKTTSTEEFPHLEWVAREYQIDAPYLVKIFELEREFHKRILALDDVQARKQEYSRLYNTVHQLKQEGATTDVQADDRANFRRLVQTFRRELAGKSVLDVGCGDGSFLRVLSEMLPHAELCGLDTSAVHLPGEQTSISFLKRDIVQFDTAQKFDVVFSHQVLEHIAPLDVPSHLRSIHSALKPQGKFLLLQPNRFWGPQDITRIVDNTFTDRVPAQGSHLNESSYCDLVPQLLAHGFTNVRTTVPLGAFVPVVRGFRVRPRINQLLEKNKTLRTTSNLFRRHGRPVFKNPIILVCEKNR